MKKPNSNKYSRLKGYLFHLVLPAIYPLMMIYYPQSLTSFHQHVSTVISNRFMLTLIVLAIIWSLYYGAFSNNKNLSLKVISITKGYMVVMAIVVSIYMFSFEIISIKIIMLVIYVSFFAYLFILEALDKRTYKFKK